MSGRAGRPAEATTRAEQAAEEMALTFAVSVDDWVMGDEDRRRLVDTALAAVPDPGDGRTVADLLNDGARAEEMLSKFDWRQDEDGWFDVHGWLVIDHDTPEAALLARLVERRGV